MFYIYGHGTYFLTLWEEYRLTESENRALTGIFCPTPEKAKRNSVQLHNEELSIILTL